MVEVREINDIQELDAYRLLWNSLLPQTANGTFFQSLDWLECYWKHFGAAQRLRTLLIYDGHDKPVGILPLVVRSEPSHIGAVSVLTYPLHDWGSFYGPIGPNPTATLLTGLRHIDQPATRGRRTTRDRELISGRIWAPTDDAAGMVLAGDEARLTVFERVLR